MNAIILSVGDELVLGQTVDTNSAWISQQLAAVGCGVLAHVTVADDQPAIERAIRDTALRCAFLIISGGIGPTEDDLTRQALAVVMNEPLELNEHWLHFLEEFFLKRGRPMPPTNKIQAMIPRGAKIITNTAGTAAGIHATLGPGFLSAGQFRSIALQQLRGRPIGRVLTKMRLVTPANIVEALNIQKGNGGLLGQILISLGYISEQDLRLALAAQKIGLGGEKPDPKVSDEYLRRMHANNPGSGARLTEAMKRAAESRHPSERQHEKQPVEVFVMPGVPKEMKIMFTRDVLPHIAAAGKGAVILPRTLHTFGLGESSVAEKLGDLMNRQRNPSVGTTVANGIVSLRVNARFDSREEAERRLDETADACRTALGDLIFGQDDETLPQVAASLLTSNQQPATSNSLTVSTAESCTGGLLAKMLTDIPGSSRYFKQGWVTYSNQAKYERLGVSMEIINVYGAVSENVVELMATHARRLAKSDYALAISGIAGPDGGTPIKPVGTVCIALAWPDPADKKSSVVEKRTFLFPGDREMIRDRSAKMALTMLRYHLLERKMPF